jgi:signal transduction histidine kinase
MNDEMISGDSAEPGGESIEAIGAARSGPDSAKARTGRFSAAAEAQEFARIRPFTIALVVIFIVSVIGLLGVINLPTVRDFFGGDFLWFVRACLGIMIVCLVVWLVLREKAFSNYIQEQLEKREEANRQLTLLLESGQEIGSSLELPEILEELLRRSFKVSGATMGAIYLWDSGASTLKAALIGGVDEKKVMFKEFPLQLGMMGEAAEHRRVIATSDMSNVDRRDNVFFGAAETGSQLIVPLVARDRLVGVMVTATQSPHDYTDEEIRLVLGLAELGSLPMANAQLYRIARRSLDVAAQQRGFTESVLDRMVAGVMTSDRHSRVAVFNVEAQRLTGYGFEERNQVMLRPELSLDDNPLGPLEHGMLEVMKDPATVREGEAVIMKKDRTLLPISFRIYPVSDGEQVLGAAAVFMEAGEQGEEGVARGLIDYQAFLRSLGARIEMLYTNPLSRVLDRLQEMDAEEWSRGRDGMTTVLQEGFDKLVRLLADVERYLNCTTTREWDSRTENDIEATLGSVVDETLKAREQDGVVVMVQLSGLPRAFGYERMIRTALREVIENAVIAASLGGKKVEVSGGTRGGFVRIEVRDTGPGIPLEARDSIYLPFFTTWEGRSGLGLSVVERIMQSLGGKVGMEDSAEGAVFYLEFPTPGLAVGRGTEAAEVTADAANVSVKLE